ncbi:MAG: hypothetical protein ACFNLN_07030, partial [Treponema socranskii subsp. buccale]
MSTIAETLCSPCRVKLGEPTLQMSSEKIVQLVCFDNLRTAVYLPMSQRDKRHNECHTLVINQAE